MAKDQKRIAKNLYATHHDNFYYWLLSVKGLKESYCIKLKGALSSDTNLSERAKNFFEEYTIFTNEMLSLVFSERAIKFKEWLMESEGKKPVYAESMLHGAKFPLSPSSAKSRPNIVKRSMFFFHKYKVEIMSCLEQEQIETMTTSNVVVESISNVPSPTVMEAVVSQTVVSQTVDSTPTVTHIHYNDNMLYALNKDSSLPFDSYQIVETIEDKQKVICFLLKHTKNQYDDIIEYLLSEIKIPRI